MAERGIVESLTMEISAAETTVSLFSNIFDSGALVFEVSTHCAYLITFFALFHFFV